MNGRGRRTLELILPLTTLLFMSPLAAASSPPYLSISNIRLDKATYTTGSFAVLGFSITAGNDTIIQVGGFLGCSNALCPVNSSNVAMTLPPSITAGSKVTGSARFFVGNVPPGYYNLTLAVVGTTSSSVPYQFEHVSAWILFPVESGQTATILSPTGTSTENSMLSSISSNTPDNTGWLILVGIIGSGVVVMAVSAIIKRRKPRSSVGSPRT